MYPRMVETENRQENAAGRVPYVRSTGEPAPTLVANARCWPPGHKVNGDDRRRHPDADERYGDRAGTDAIRLDIRDALILQSFDPGFPVQGTKTKQFEQIGNAVPPRLAAHILAAVTGRPPPTFDRG